MTGGLTLSPDALARLMPMHLIVDRHGTILSAGATLERMRAPRTLRGGALFEIFDMRRPHGVQGMHDLAGRDGEAARLAFLDPPTTTLKGHFVSDGAGAYIFDLCFGITVREAVAEYGLTATDFAPTSLAVEMLYVLEANAAAMDASRDLNRRLHDAKAVAERIARTDALTGLENRRAMEAVVEDLAERGLPFGLMHVDLDYFKLVNDSHGHAAGDHVLNHVAQLLRRMTREGDHVIRLGGDEFVIVLRGLVKHRELALIAERIISALEEPIPYENALCRVSASIGVTTSDLYDEPEITRMLNDADRALYRSKLGGRSRSTIFDVASAREPASQSPFK
jgi:diguanylate cyclase (GGDEF)-like protein